MAKHNLINYVTKGDSVDVVCNEIVLVSIKSAKVLKGSVKGSVLEK